MFDEQKKLLLVASIVPLSLLSQTSTSFVKLALPHSHAGVGPILEFSAYLVLSIYAMPKIVAI